jgi:hypothetical protein
LGISLPQKDIDALLREVDSSGTGELEMDGFTQMMVLTLQKKAAYANDHRAHDREQPKKQDMQQVFLPFEVVALAYRRCTALASGAINIISGNANAGEVSVNKTLRSQRTILQGDMVKFTAQKHLHFLLLKDKWPL